MPDRRCAILVPVTDRIEPECERSLAELAKRGIVVKKMTGHSAIDVARNMMATDALDEGFDELMWIDSDIAFSVDAFDRIRAHDKPLVCGIYPKKAQRELACHTLPGTKEIVFGKEGGLVPILYVGTGFLYTQRVVYETIRERLALPKCNTRFGQGFVPYFQPMIVPDGEVNGEPRQWYLGEDYSFCERARRAGFELLADTTLRLTHIGRYGFGWEDAAGDRVRYANYRIVFEG